MDFAREALCAQPVHVPLLETTRDKIRLVTDSVNVGCRSQGQKALVQAKRRREMTHRRCEMSQQIQLGAKSTEERIVMKEGSKSLHHKVCLRGHDIRSLIHMDFYRDSSNSVHKLYTLLLIIYYDEQQFYKITYCSTINSKTYYRTQMWWKARIKLTIATLAGSLQPPLAEV